MRLAIVVTFLNEEGFLPTFLESIVRQSRRPDLLLLVDDGSDDGSGPLVDAFVQQHDFARAIHRPRRPVERDRLATAAELRAFHWGVEQLEGAWDVVTKMDADLDLHPHHVESVMSVLEMQEDVGIAGGYLVDRMPDGSLHRDPHPSDHVRGANKFYRWQCFEQIAPIPEILGWDTIDEVRARMHGWRTVSVEISGSASVHLRPTGAHGGRLRAFRRWGLCAWGYGADPLYVVFGAGTRLRYRPYLLASLNYLWGYASAGIRRSPQVDASTRAYTRREQRRRIRTLVRDVLS